MKKRFLSGVSLVLSLSLISLMLPCVSYAQDSTEESYVSGITDAEIDEVVGELGISDEVSLMNNDVDKLVSFSGQDMFETAALEAAYAYPEGSSSAIIAGSGDAWVDSLAVSSLASKKGPILFSYRDSLPDQTLSALKSLGVSSVIVVGGSAVISDSVLNTLSANGISVEERLWGDDCYGTQLAIYNYGASHNIWSGDIAFVASSLGFGDALSASPVAYDLKAPIFIAKGDGLLTEEAQKTLINAAKDGKYKEVVALGGSSVISERTMGFLDAVAALSGGVEPQRLWGQDQYKTSVAIANWAVSKKGFSNVSPGYATGRAPYDALAGSVVQGISKSPLLLVDDNYRDAISYTTQNSSQIGQVKFFGGEAVVSNNVRSSIISVCFGVLMQENTGISFDRMVDLEYASIQNFDSSCTRDELVRYIGAECNFSSPDCYQFAKLNDGYSGSMSAADLNNFISSNSKGANGILAGQGQAFINASKQYGVNEVYLLCHAILETGWGTSQLSTGWTYNDEIPSGHAPVNAAPDGKTYYNFFGIGAVDNDPLWGGRITAIKNGWDTPEKAIIGGAKWIASSTNYLNNQWSQNTLYKMRWNYFQAAKDGSVWHQYATAKHWATGIAKIINQCYSSAGITPANSGLIFLIPVYN